MPLRSGSRSSRPCPAYEVAGDSFDYALNTDVLHVAIIDSVGHDIESSVISHLVNGSLRNSRRNGRDLPRPTSGPTRR
jgi:serine phosphatase RsbU (regulator of sigma subunit)